MNEDLFNEAMKKLASVRDNLVSIENVYCEENCDLDATDGLASLAEAITLLELAAALHPSDKDTTTP